MTQWTDPVEPDPHEQGDTLGQLEVGEVLLGTLDQLRVVDTKFGAQTVATFKPVQVARRNEQGAVSVEKHDQADLFLHSWLHRTLKSRHLNVTMRIERIPNERGKNAARYKVQFARVENSRAPTDQEPASDDPGAPESIPF